MKKLSLYVFLVLMFCNVGLAEIKYKKVECEDEIFIDFIDNDKRAVLYRFFPKKFNYYSGEYEVVEKLTYINFYKKNSKYQVPRYRLHRETGELKIYRSDSAILSEKMLCEPLDLLDAVTEGKSDFDKYLDERVDKLKKEQKEKNKF